MEEEKADWDLQAVVRRFTTTTSPSFSLVGVAEIHQPQPLGFLASTPCSSSPPPPAAAFLKGGDQSAGLFGILLDPFGGSSGGIGEGLEDLCKPFCQNLRTFNPTSASAIFGGLTEQKEPHQPPQARQQSLHLHLHQLHRQHQNHHPQIINQTQIMSVAAAARLISPGTDASPQSQSIIGANSGCTTVTQSRRTKKRKNVMKKVCHVPAVGLSSDMWAWRKYGQKAIKGSPHPRGYYRCSSSKGCLARKQVERNRSHPNMFIVTYTSEHNHPRPTHRNSLAGSTRQKATTSQAQNGAAAPAGDSGSSASASTSTNTTTTPPEQNSCCSPATSLSPATEYDDLLKHDDHHEMGLCETLPEGDLFMGFKELDGFDSAGDCFPDQFTAASLEFPWLTSSSSAATAAGGS